MTLMSDLSSNDDRKDRFYETNRVSPCEIVYKKKCPDHRGNERLFSEKYLSKKQSTICYFRIA